ncbi:LppU/SCO3897 family protein [Streptomyces sp. NPDC003753]
MTTPPPQGTNPYAQQPTVPMGQQLGQPGVAQQPYAPQQTYPQQQGYPQQQQPYPPFPQQQGAPAFPQQQGAPAPLPPQAGPGKRASKKAIRIIGAIVIAVIIGVIKFGAGWFLTRDDAETTSVGSCMHNDGTNSKPDLKDVDCSSSNAQYKVVQKFDGTSDENKCQGVKDATISYIQYGGGHDVVLCLNELKK